MPKTRVIVELVRLNFRRVPIDRMLALPQRSIAGRMRVG